MKVKHFLADFDEEFTSVYNRNQHYKKHAEQEHEFNMSETEYENYSEELMHTPCDYKNIFGYVAKDNVTGNTSYIKYDKNKEFMTVYNDNNKTITSFKRSYRDLIGKMYDANQRYEYIDEIPRNK